MMMVAQWHMGLLMVDRGGTTGMIPGLLSK